MNQTKALEQIAERLQVLDQLVSRIEQIERTVKAIHAELKKQGVFNVSQ